MQTCPLTLCSWTYKAEDVLYGLLTEPFTSFTYSPGKWSVVNFKHTGKIVVVPAIYPPANLSLISFELQLQRNPLLPMLTVIFPLFMLNIILMASLFMDPKEGSRLDLGTATFLSYTMLIIIVTDTLPASSSNIPFVGKCFKIVLNVYTWPRGVTPCRILMWIVSKRHRSLHHFLSNHFHQNAN